MRTALVTLLFVFSALLTAQISENISNNVDEDQERLHRFDIDFGTGGAATVSVSLNGDNALAGLRVLLIDRDELVTNGSAGAFNEDSDPGTGAVTPSLAVNYTGVRTFIVVVGLEDNTNGPANYTGTISVNAVATSITDNGDQLRENELGMMNIDRLFNIGIRTQAMVNDNSQSVEFRVDFGAGGQAGLWLFVEGDDDGAVEIFEMSDSTGLPVAISPAGGVSSSAGTSWQGEGNFQTANLTGMRRFRVVMSTTVTSDVELRVNIAFSSNVSIPAFTELHIMGSLSADQRRIHRFSVDFGSVATTLALMQVHVTETGTLSTAAFDIDELAANGPAAALINPPYLTQSYTGVHDFIIAVSEEGGAIADYHYMLVLAVPLAAITTHTPQNGMTDESYGEYHSRIVLGAGTVDTGASSSVEFMVDFGGVAQSIDFWAQAVGSATGQISVNEMLASGAANPLGTAISGAGSSWEDDGNYTSSSRSGVVRFRLTATATAGMDFRFSVALPSTVTLVAINQLSFTGTLAASGERFHRFQIDFGASATDYSLFLHSFNVTGNIDIQFVDLDELAANGSTTGFGSQPPFLTQAYTGVREFLFIVFEDSGTAGATYTINLGVATTAASVTGAATPADDDSLQFIFDRAAQRAGTFAATDTVTSEFNVTYDATAHTASYWFQASGDIIGTVELFVVIGGTPTLLDTHTFAGSAEFELNGVTAAYSGTVRFRVVVTATGAGDVDWVVVFDSTVAVAAIGGGGGGGGGGGDDEGGCSTDGGNSPWLALMAVLAMLALAVRTRRA